jgi:hypothetical protein
MSKRKRPAPEREIAARQRRIANAKPARVPQSRPKVGGDLSDIPEEAFDAYLSAFEWATESPELAAELLSWPPELWDDILVSVAYAEQLGGLSEDQVLGAVQNLRTWAILSGIKFLYTWPEPVAVMSDEQIIAAVRKDAAEGRIAPPDPNE